MINNNYNNNNVDTILIDIHLLSHYLYLYIFNDKFEMIK